MKLDDILALPVSDLAADNAVLFLWATAPLLPEAIKVVEAWGFEYKTQIVWIKDRIGLGWYVRNRHELLLIATKGDLPLPKPADRPTSVLVSRRRKHSQKPNEMYEVIERMYPELSKIELFARSHRRGWDVWGNQASEHPDGMLEFDGCDGLRMQDQPTRTNPNEEQEGEQRLDTRHS